MLKKLISGTFSLLALTTVTSVFADDVSYCKVEVAVSTPPIQINQNVAFNVSSDSFNKSITLKGGSAPAFIDKIPCTYDSHALFIVSATLYNTPSNDLNRSALPHIGQCELKAGPLSMDGANNSLSVVFPNDFICNN